MTQPKGFVVEGKTLGMSFEEIYLWLEASFKTMVTKVR
jgi:hypothetical protein